MRAYFAEFIGTFCLVFVGTGAIIGNDISGGVLGNAGIALAFGLIVTLMIIALGAISGAHINPAVSIALTLSGQLPPTRLAPYIVCQCSGALLASAILLWLLPEHPNLGATLPAAGSVPAFALEILLTTVLIFVILTLIAQPFAQPLISAMLIGATVGLAAFCGGSISGASMNPARSLGPALLSGHYQTLWIYLTAPILGAMLAITGCRWVHQKPCCQGFVTQKTTP